ncbi:MAG: dihydrodipicolinate synthase family protein [Candidatus Latescibacterota bacterium]|nr:dihydrodipicolinate synthase family protein [Candidatus Latescibacterota bacterium]
MPLSNEELLADLDSVISIPVIPFANGGIDYEGHGCNIDYLLNKNYLDGGRRRVVGIAGTSLIHHISTADQLKLMEFTGQHMGDCGLLMSGIAPNPIDEAEALITEQCKLSRPPDVFLLMPLAGVADPEGIYQEFMAIVERLGGEHGARFLYYLRQSNQADTAVRLINDSPYVLGVKIGTSPDDVASIVQDVNDGAGIVIWGIGDRSTGPAKSGTQGHTSGINILFARASDEINNAQRARDWSAAKAVEDKLTPLEEIRFRDNRRYNYSAVVEAIHLSGLDDIAAGDGGPFNPRVPQEVADEVKRAIEPILEYH